ncbi:hypothetical protein [Aeromonas bestiarum]|uniref:hypothetical protein n=1 Tax=Aeromonas bestiarum TaxID=105751 RepID=UPI0011AF62F0|nr:hypothetical protein [Aeromonas bestiarum]
MKLLCEIVMLNERWLEIRDYLYESECSFADNLSAKTVFLNYALSLINSDNRNETLEDFFSIIVEGSGCVEDFEILEMLADKLVAEHVLTEDELIVFLKNADFGRWS